MFVSFFFLSFFPSFPFLFTTTQHRTIPHVSTHDTYCCNSSLNCLNYYRIYKTSCCYCCCSLLAFLLEFLVQRCTMCGGVCVYKRSSKAKAYQKDERLTNIIVLQQHGSTKCNERFFFSV